MSAMLDLGDGLRAARVRKGKSQVALAADLDVEPATVSRWESGKRAPELSSLIAIAAALAAIVIITADGVRVKFK